MRNWSFFSQKRSAISLNSFLVLLLGLRDRRFRQTRLHSGIVEGSILCRLAVLLRCREETLGPRDGMLEVKRARAPSQLCDKRLPWLHEMRVWIPCHVLEPIIRKARDPLPMNICSRRRQHPHADFHIISDPSAKASNLAVQSWLLHASTNAFDTFQFVVRLRTP